MLGLRLFALSSLLAASGCSFPPSLGEGQVRCSPDGGCPSGYHCGVDQRCYTGTASRDGGCIPARCPQNGCGTMIDGCGHVVDCGNSCPATAPNCGGGGANVCGVSSCDPITQCPAGACGTLSDGCKGTFDCTCPGGQSCAGGGTPNRCCAPMTACPSGADCGRAPDGCGGAIVCGGACTGQRFCGGGGVPNLCGPNNATCTPRTCAQLGKTCGSSSDGCGDILPTCGVCSTGKTCVNNVCI